jgi:hypothetical protein
MDSSRLVGVLQDLGLNIGASAIYDFLKAKFGSQSTVEKMALEQELSAFLKIHGVKAEAATVIKVFADSGFLSIRGSELVAPDGILIGACEGARFPSAKIVQAKWSRLQSMQIETLEWKAPMPQ